MLSSPKSKAIEGCSNSKLQSHDVGVDITISLPNRPGGTFSIHVGINFSVGIICPPQIQIGLMHLPKLNGDKSPMSLYVPTGLSQRKTNNDIVS